MEIIVKKGKMTPFDLDMTKRAIEFYLKNLLPEEVYKQTENLTIEVHLRKKMLPGNISATVDHDVYFELSTIFDNHQEKFKLTVVKNEETSTADYLKVLAHECVHIKQALMRELKYFAEIETMQTVIVWRDRIMSDLSGVKHKHLPWEKEAFSKQEPLSERFILHFAEVLKQQRCTD